MLQQYLREEIKRRKVRLSEIERKSFAVMNVRRKLVRLIFIGVQRLDSLVILRLAAGLVNMLAIYIFCFQKMRSFNAFGPLIHIMK